MTDFQFKSIIRMILAIAKNEPDVKAIIKELEKLLEDDSRQIKE